MIIDFHTHTFPDEIAEKAVSKLRRASHIRAYSDGTAEGLRKTSAEAGVGLSVILPVATAARQVEHINDRAILRNREEAERARTKTAAEPAAGGAQTTDSRLLSFGCMHPEYPAYKEELRRIAREGVPGIKLHPYFQDCTLEDIRCLRILDAAAENELIVVTHAGYDQGFPGQHNCTVPMIRQVMRQVRGITLVAAHMGGWKEWEQVPELLADTGVYLDTCFSVGYLEPDDGEEAYWAVDHAEPDAGMTGEEDRVKAFRETAACRSVFGSLQLLQPEPFAAIVRAFPAGHVLFATDSPWSSAEKAVSFVQAAPLSEAEKASILGGAAEELLRKSPVFAPHSQYLLC